MIPDAKEVKEETKRNNEKQQEETVREIVKRINQYKRCGVDKVPLGNLAIDDFVRQKFIEKGYVFEMDTYPYYGTPTLEVINLARSG